MANYKNVNLILKKGNKYIYKEDRQIRSDSMRAQGGVSTTAVQTPCSCELTHMQAGSQVAYWANSSEWSLTAAC